MSLAEDVGKNLVTPAQAVDLVWRSIGTRYQARALRADAIHSGELTIYAERVLHIEEAIPTLEFEDVIKGAKQYGEAGTIAEIGGDFLRMSCLWPDEVRYWDWERGNIFLNMADDLPSNFWGFAIEGAMLKRAAVLSLTGRTSRTGVGRRPLNRAA